MKKGLLIARQLLLGMIMLQLLNLSICSQSYWEYYNYSSHANTYDPTETIVEWVVEMKKGNQDIFSYNSSPGLKGLNKNFSWHVDLHHSLPLLYPIPTGECFTGREAINGKPRSMAIDIISPPPESLRAA